jgi:hypothetical protein
MKRPRKHKQSSSVKFLKDISILNKSINLKLIREAVDLGIPENELLSEIDSHRVVWQRDGKDVEELFNSIIARLISKDYHKNKWGLINFQPDESCLYFEAEMYISHLSKKKTAISATVIFSANKNMIKNCCNITLNYYYEII